MPCRATRDLRARLEAELADGRRCRRSPSGSRRSRRARPPASTCATRGESSAPSRSPSSRATRPLPAPRGYPGPVTWSGLRVDPAGRTADWIDARARGPVRGRAASTRRAALRERFDPALPAFSAIGYREAWAVLDGAGDRRRGHRQPTPAATWRSPSASGPGSAPSPTWPGSTPRRSRPSGPARQLERACSAGPSAVPLGERLSFAPMPNDD